MTIQIYTNFSELKPRLLQISNRYSNNSYYQDNPKRFSLLLILIEDHPTDYVALLESDYQYILIKSWINGLFQIENSELARTFTLADKIKLILNNITNLPYCKCKAKLRKLQSLTM